MLKYFENSKYLTDHLDATSLSAVERRIFYELILNAEECRGSVRATVPTSEIKKILSGGSGTKQTQLITFGQKVLSCGFKFLDGKEFTLVFNSFSFDENEFILYAFGDSAIKCMKLKKEVALLSDDSGMENYSGLKLPFSKLLYRLCMENEQTGMFRLTMDELRDIMGYSKGECTASVLNRYLVPAINEMYAYREDVRYTKYSEGKNGKPPRSNATTGIEIRFGKQRRLL